MTIPSITPIPTPTPNRNTMQQEEFNAAVATMFAAIPVTVDDWNASIDAQNALAQDLTILSELVPEALAAANFQGKWSDLTGEISAPASVFHDGEYWVLAEDLADVTAKEPGVDSEWISLALVVAELSTVAITGDYNDLTNRPSLTNFASPTFTGAIYNDGSQRGNIVSVPALDIDCSQGNYFTKSISANVTFTFSSVPSSRAYGFTLALTVSGDRTVTWPSGVEWPENQAPAISPSKTHLFMFATNNGGTTWRGAALVDYEA